MCQFCKLPVFLVGASFISLANIAVAQSAPTFLNEPNHVTVADGSSFTVNVQVATSNFSSVTWRVNLTGRTLDAVSTASSQINNLISASVLFGPVAISDSGPFSVVAINDYGVTLSATRTLTVTPSPPSITVNPTGQAVTVRSSVTLSVSASGTAPLAYQWRNNNSAIPGATSATITFNNVQLSDAGIYTVTVTNGMGSITSNPAVLAVSLPVSPSFTSQPSSQTVTAGGNVSFSAAASGTTPLSYQWRKDESAIVGATNSTLTLSSVQSADSGSYTVIVSNSAGSVSSNSAVLVVTPAGPSARLSNLSVRAAMAADQTLIVGFSVSGGSRSILVRGVGPTLGSLGLAGTMVDPRLELYNGSTLIGQNDNWSNSATLSAAFASIGAFPLAANSSDAAERCPARLHGGYIKAHRSRIEFV